MRKSLAIPAFVIASVISTGALAAAALTDTGKITALDRDSHQITLADGKVFQVPVTWNFSSHKVGDSVKITYEMQGGHMVASTVIAAT
jgi:hypothetical protein